jgi:hypothetical protein
MECPLDWVAIGPGPVAPSGSSQVHQVAKSRTVVLAATGFDLAEVTRSERYDTIVADLPRLQDPREELRGVKEWLHTFRGVECFAKERLSPDGILVLIVPDVALPWLAAATELHICQLIAWQKKYAPQNDAKSLLAPMHDFVVVLSPNLPDSMHPLHLDWSTGGKTEDATRQHATDCAASGRSAAAPARLKPPALWAWIASNLVKSSRSVLDLTASGFGICDHLPITVQRTDVVWDSDPDRSEILHLLKAAHIDVNERPKPSTTGTGCECAALEIEENSRREYRRSVVLERVRAPEPGGSVVIDTGAHDPVAVATHWLRGTVDMVTTTADYAVDAKELLTSEGVVMVALGDRIHDSLRQAVQRIPLAPVGHIVFFDPKRSSDCTIWLVMAPWSQSASRQRGRSVEHEWSNPDGDPRGNWRDPKHKGAKSGNGSLSYSLMAPPYRWDVASGVLPPGMWRLNATTGLIWGRPTVPGTWTFKVTVSDQTGKSTAASITLTVDPNAALPAPPALSWLRLSPQSGQRLRILRTHFTIPLGEEVAVELEARGGMPFVETVGPPGRSVAGERSRYWEFTLQTLHAALAEDRAIWPVGRRSSKPRIKKFENDARERPTALRTCVERLTSSSGDGAFELRELVAFERAVNIESGRINIFGASHSRQALLNFVVEDCASCADLAEGTACTADHAAQRAAYLLNPVPSPTPPPPGWLNEFAPTLATDLLNDNEAVALTRGVLSDALVSAIRSWRPATTTILYSRSLQGFVGGGAVIKIPEFQWTT